MKQKKLILSLAWTILSSAQAMNDSIATTSVNLANEEEYNTTTAEITIATTSTINVSRNMDFTKAVGEIPIQSDVTPLGGRTYTVPIEAYPGIGDMTPQIALVYNSFQNNGIVGIGWGVSGLSSIVRTNKSIHYDGRTAGISQDADDAFVLDGQRLVRIADENGSPCFMTAQGNIKVTATLSGNDISKFTVLYPNGKQGIYTSSDEGKMTYPITQYGNIDGIIIDYTYICVQNNHLIQSITYNTDAKITFTYEDRPDTISTYSNGHLTETNKRLSKITSSLRNTTLGEYSLSYSSINAVSHLIQIGYSAQGQSLNPLTFEYGEGSPENTYTSRTISLDYAYVPTEPKNNKHTRITKGKFDYNLSDGILSLPNRESYSLVATLDPFTGFYAIIGTVNKYDGQDNDYIYITPDLENNNSFVTTLPIGQGYIEALCMDLTGTQQDYIVRINNNIINDRDQVSFTVYRYSSAEFSCETLYTRTYDFGSLFIDPSENKSLHPKHFYSGDFNGDGIQDIMAVTSSMPYENANVQCRIYDIANDELLYNGTPFSCNFIQSSYWGGYTAEQIKNMDHLFVMDYNNDGKSDICIIKGDGTYIYEFDSNASGALACSQVNTYTDLTRSSLTNRQLLIGEFNGDGLADLLLSPQKNNSDVSWKMFRSTGNGSFAALTFTGPTADDGECDDFIIQDVNCDGKSDLIKCYESKFTTFINENNFPNVEVCTYTMEKKSAIAPTSITSHNYFSHVLTLKDNNLVKHSFLNDVNKQRLLTTMTDCYCNKECTTYKYPFDENPSYHTDNSGATFPYIVLKEKIPFIASSYEVFNGSNVNNRTYQFTNMIMHRQGLGMCGMEQTVVNDEQFIVSKWYAPKLYGVLVKDTIKSRINGTLISTGSYSYDIKYPYNDAIVQTNLTTKTTKDHLQGFSTTSMYTYNQYGFPITETNTTSDGYTTNVIQSVTHHIGSQYILNVVNERTVTTSYNDMTHTEKTAFPEMYYDKPMKKYTYINGNQASYETFSYSDLCGLVSQQTVQSYSSPNTLTTSYTYDLYGRLLQKTTPEQYTESYTYNTYGQVASFKNVLGNTDTYTYDIFGRKTRTDFADGTWETIQYSWEPSLTSNSYGYSRLETQSNGQTSQFFYDTKQREVKNINSTVLEQYLIIEKTYDTYGNMLTESVPLLTSSTKISPKQYTYDEYNRLIYFENLHKNITYAYNKNQTKTVKEGIEIIRTYDSQGNMTAVTDTTGTTTYIYRPDGQLLSTTAPCGLTTSIEYDSYGRRTKLIDPCAGTTTFTYDDSGHLASKTDGTGKQTLMRYDTFGRLTQKEYVGLLTTAYSYNTKGLLTGEFDSNGAVRFFYYDTFGRLLQDYQAVDNPDQLNLSRYYNYASNGNLTSVNYVQEDGIPIEFGNEKYEYINGHLKRISFKSISDDDEVDIWNILSIDRHGMADMVQSGSLTHHYIYDRYLNPYYMATEDDEFYIIQEIEYFFDYSTGNLESRYDITRDQEEFFSYDNMNRLTRDNTTTYRYDNQTGNMTYNSRLGNLTYGSSLQVGYHLSVIDPIFAEESGLSNKYLPKTQQTITYNALSRPATITEGNYHLDFTYNGNGERIHSYFYKKETPDVLTGTVTTDLEHRYYLGNIYEQHIKEDGSNRYILYLGGDAYSAPAAFILDNQYGPHIAYICRDYQGSITHVVSDYYSKEYSYDAWGNLRDPESYELSLPGLEQHEELFLGRGYTGHEHHGYFGLINMNARLYNPYVGRFISPDPFVQMPDNSQNFNRFIYCLNNPLRYTDESGEFWFEIFNYVKDFFTNTFVKVWSQGINAWTDADNWHSTHMAFKINQGLFEGNFKQILSRFTWESPQTILGYGLSQGLNIFNDVKSVTYYGGATVTETKSSGWSAVTLGSYIAGKEGIKADPYNALFQHEYGHYLQSQAWGPMYLGKAGIPSILDTKGRKGDHDLHPIEQDANARAFEYFNKNVKGFYKTSTQHDSGDIGWNFYENPLNLHGTNRDGYVDYKRQIDDVRKLRVSFRAAEYLMLNPITLGLYNHIRYNHTKIRK